MELRLVRPAKPGCRMCFAALACVLSLTTGLARAEAASTSEEVGYAVGSTMRDIGHGARDVGRDIGHGAAEFGRGVGHAAKGAVHAVGDAGREVGHAARDGSKALVRGIKGEGVAGHGE